MCLATFSILYTACDKDKEPDEPTIDCANIPQGPFEAREIMGSIAGEDFAFDDQGNMLGIGSYALFRVPYEGDPELFVPNVYYDAGMVFLPSDELLVADNSENTLVAIDESGVSHVIATDLAWPNGIAVHPSGWVLVTEYAADRVRLVDLETGETSVVVEGISGPNGIAFGLDYDEVFISGFWNSEIYKLEIDEHGSPGALELWVSDLGPQIDGVGVDACGNVYACGYSDGALLRISPDGSEVSEILPAGVLEHTTNLHWGSGIGGWKENAVYVSNYSTAFEIEIGVPGNPLP